MPFSSKSQARWMFANKPEMAKEWASHTESIKKLPEKVKKHKNSSLTDIFRSKLSDKNK